MSSPASVRPARERGFTLLEIMVALAVLAVGAVCVLGTFAAAIALHLQREDDLRAKSVIEEARREAQAVFESHRATANQPLPEPLKNQSWSRDVNVTWSVSFASVEGVKPEDGCIAILTIRQGGEDAEAGGLPPRVEQLFLTGESIPPDELKTSVTFEREKKDDRDDNSDPYGRRR